MIAPKEYYILTFDTTTAAMQAEKYLQSNFSIAVMPVPREISSGCGLSIRFQDPDITSIMEFLKSTTQVTGTLYKMNTKKIDGKRQVDKLYVIGEN